MLTDTLSGTYRHYVTKMLGARNAERLKARRPHQPAARSADQTARAGAGRRRPRRCGGRRRARRAGRPHRARRGRASPRTATADSPRSATHAQQRAHQRIVQDHQVLVAARAELRLAEGAGDLVLALGGHRHRRVDELRSSGSPGSTPASACLDLGIPALDRVDGDRDQQVVLGGEVVVEARARQAGALADGLRGVTPARPDSSRTASPARISARALRRAVLGDGGAEIFGISQL